MSSGKHLNIDIDFNANTTRAKKEIQDLQGQLNKLLDSLADSSGEFGNNLGSATSAAVELKRHLSAAVDVNTGKLNLNDFSKSLSSAGRDLNYFREKLTAAGPEGQKAFRALTNSIYSAEAPLKRTSALMQEFATTLKNTARWQISSSILHGFMGSIQTAYHYAQDLNESLNNIRIVTGQNTDQMAAFAKQANESAKALNTTTTKYTDAALIYYQQGLSDKEVKERTDVTVKMANVARESAEEVSNQMTAVWNNFNKDGNASVESFADKMTALGAATASSTSEIAEGLSKFSGVADTIGLSFDYATSALATVTATSRESADVVGTAFKTMFARMEGLKQGETEEDGTDLNKYSQGLAKIGVQIKDQNGELKNMDQILSEMGDRWQGLSRDQKVATAQTVAGVRQYSQLMTLMDNWDFFQKNLAVAQGSEGTLQEQADIYAESWEAAEKRVQAAMEKIYSQLLDDEAFIDLNNGFADFIELISNAIKGLGGLKGVLAGLGVLVTKIFNKQLSDSINNLFDTPKKRLTRWANMQDEALKQDIKASPEDSEVRKQYSELRDLNVELVENEKKLTAEQKEQLKLEIEQYRIRLQKLEQTEKDHKEQQKILETMKKKQKNTEDEYHNAAEKVDSKREKILEKHKNNKTGKERQFNEANDAIEELITNSKALDEKKIFNSQQYKDLEEAIKGTRMQTAAYVKDLIAEEKAARKAQIANEELLGQETITDVAGEAVKDSTRDADKVKGGISNKIKNPNDPSSWDKDPNKKLPFEKNTGAFFTNTAMAISSVTMAMQSLVGIWDVWNSKDMSAGEKAITTMTTLGAVIPGVISGLQGVQAAAKAIKGIEMGMGAASGLMLGIAAAIGVVSFAIGELTDWWNKEENAAKEASETVENYRSTISSLTNDLNSLKENFKAYNEAKTQLNVLTVGTEEWRTATEKVNEQVNELLEKYPALAEKAKKVNGVLTISEEDQEDFIEKQNMYIEEMGKGYAASQIHQNNTRLAVAKKDFFRDNIGMDDKQQEIASKASMVVSPAFTPIVQALNDFSDHFTDDFDTVIDRLADEYDRQGEKVLSNTTAIQKATQGNTYLTKALYDNKVETRNLIQQMNKTKTDNVQKAKEILEQEVNNSEFKKDETLTNIGAGIYGKKIEDKQTEYSEDGKHSDEAVQKKYADLMAEQGYDIAWQENKDGNIGSYLVNGQLQDISDQIARSYVATHEAIEEFKGDLDGLVSRIKLVTDRMQNQTGKKFTKELNEIIIGLANGSLEISDLNKKQIDLIKNNKEDLNKAIAEIFKDENGGEISKDQMKELFGITKDKDTIYKEISEEAEGYDWEALKNNFVYSIRKGFEDIDFEKEDISGGKIESFKTLLEQRYLETGDKSIIKFSHDLYKKATDKEKFIDTFNNIDWGSTSVRELKDTFEELGAGSVLTTKELVHMIDAMHSSTFSMENLSDQYAKFSEIVKGLDFGETLNKQQYADMITSMGDAASLADNYFTKMLDGTYQLVGSAKDFKDTVKNFNIDQAVFNYKQKNEQIEKMKGFYGQGKSQERSNFENIINSKLGSGGSNYSSSGVNALKINRESVKNKFDLAEALFSTEAENKILNAAKEGFNETIDNHGVIGNQKIADDLLAFDNALKKYENSFDDLSKNQKAFGEEVKEIKNQIALSAENLQELNQMRLGPDGKARGKNDADALIDDDSYGYALNLMHQKERLEGIDENKINDYSNHISQLATLKEGNLGNEGLDDGLSKNTELAKELAIQVERMNIGVKSLSDNWKDWSSILKNSSKGSEEYFQASNGLREALADIFDVSKDYISLNMVDKWSKDSKALELIGKAAKGDGEAIDKLREKASKDIVANIAAAPNIDTKKFNSFFNEVRDLVEKSNIDDLEIGADLDNKKLIEKLNQMADKTGVTVEQMNAALSTLGVDAQYDIQQKETTAEVPVFTKRLTTRDLTGGHAPTGMQDYEQKEEITSVEYKKIQGKVPVAAIAAMPPGTKAKMPKITGTTKAARGSANNGSRANAGGKKSSGKGGGGKGKGKKTQYKDEFDRYWQINRTIEKTDAELTKLGKTYDHVFGLQRIKNLQSQNKQLKIQLANIEALRKAQGKIGKNGKPNKGSELADLKKEGKKYGAKVNKYGVITNYNKITKKEFKNKNKNQERYEKFKKFISDSERLSKAIYDADQKRRDLINQMIENNREAWILKVTARLETHQFKRELKEFKTNLSTSLSDITRGFQLNPEINTKKLKNNLKTIKQLTADAFTSDGKYNAVLKEYQQMNWADENWEKYKKNTPETKRKWKSHGELKKEKENYFHDYIEPLAKDAETAFSAAWQIYLDALSKTKETYEQINKELENQQDILNYAQQMLELQYGADNFNDDAYNARQEAQDAYIDSLKLGVELSNSQAEDWQERFEEATALAEEEAKATGVHFSVDEWDTWTDAMKEAYNNKIEAEKHARDLSIQYVQEVGKQTEDQIKKQFYNVEMNLTDNLGFDYHIKQWERANNLADKFYDETEKIYHIETLLNKYDQSIQSEKQLKNAQKLKKLRDQELKTLREKEQLTKYDIEAANKRYEIYLKQIALEDARNNKNTMKMTRNEQGNWSYQYVANKDDVLKKQQDLRNSTFDLYEYSKKTNLDARGDELKSLQQELQELQELEIQKYKGSITDKQYAQQRADTIMYYDKLIANNRELIANSEKDLTASTLALLQDQYANNYENFKAMNESMEAVMLTCKEYGLTTYSELFTAIGGYGAGAADAMIIAFTDEKKGAKYQIEQAFIGIRDASKTYLSSGEGSLALVMNSVTNKIIDSWNADKGVSVKTAISNCLTTTGNLIKEYSEKVKPFFEDASKAAKGVPSALASIKGKAEDAKKKIKKYFKTDKDSVMKTIKEIVKAYGKFNTKLQESIDKTKKLKKAQAKIKTPKVPSGGGSVSDGGGSGGGSGSGNGGSNNKTKPKKTKKYYVQIKQHKKGKLVSISKKDYPSALRKSFSTKSAAKKAARDWFQEHSGSNYAALPKIVTAKPYKTGGYTGNWPSSGGIDKDGGRLAILHQKELVLNKADTKNMLQTINAVRDLQSLNSSITKTITDSVSEMIANGFNEALSKMTDIKDNKETVVIENITAEFPNAENVAEIKEAIMSLPRLASQYVNRK